MCEKTWAHLSRHWSLFDSFSFPEFHCTTRPWTYYQASGKAEGLHSRLERMAKGAERPVTVLCIALFLAVSVRQAVKSDQLRTEMRLLGLVEWSKALDLGGTWWNKKQRPPMNLNVPHACHPSTVKGATQSSITAFQWLWGFSKFHAQWNCSHWLAWVDWLRLASSSQKANLQKLILLYFYNIFHLQKYVKLKQIVPRGFLGVERWKLNAPCQGKTMKNHSPRLSILLLRRPWLAKIKVSKDYVKITSEKSGHVKPDEA